VNARVRVKICGITNCGDALAAMDAGADAVGFNLFAGSKRHVPLADLMRWLPSIQRPDVLWVGLMVDPSIEEIAEALPFFDAIQLHGRETPALCAAAAAIGPVWKAFPLDEHLDEAAVAPFQAQGIIIDTSLPGAFGGTGVLIDLDHAARFVSVCPGRQVWLSGGLNPGNVAAAVEKVRPHGVDVSTGVEIPGNPRRKDPARIRAFIAAAHQASAAPQLD
jgi:phosphoribosylanthranilate isomerase